MSTSRDGQHYHHGDLPEQLISAALALLPEAGDAGPSLRAVARQAGVSAMAPYRHFADKAALMEAVADRGFSLLGDCLEAAGGADAVMAFVAQGAAYVAFATAHPVLFRLMFVNARPQPGTPLGASTSRAYAALLQRAEAVADLSGAVSRDDLALIAWSMVHGLAILLINQKIVSQTCPNQALVTHLMGQFAGMASRPASG